jgi:hypothetical protein
MYVANQHRTTSLDMYRPDALQCSTEHRLEQLDHGATSSPIARHRREYQCACARKRSCRAALELLGREHTSFSTLHLQAQRNNGVVHACHVEQSTNKRQGVYQCTRIDGDALVDDVGVANVGQADVGQYHSCSWSAEFDLVAPRTTSARQYRRASASDWRCTTAISVGH